ncbi:MAG: hypothetical protein DRH90_23715 [Deltaproteobacteria bacterium]|nr:MAG: hypothetical protein DRH90_23715 [Deltaproteobacteria bacterium]RLC16198.1 MAG: hypothetical protein DRI24_09010 [Deltaproteobacteria bacterium]
MKEHQTAIYLTCTKNRSLQKKHIDVCRKCSSNDNCREFREYKQLEPAVPRPDRSIPELTEIPLVHIIEQLIEIRKLVGDGRSTPLLNDPGDAVSMANASLPQYLKVELEGIRSLCSTVQSSSC